MATINRFEDIEGWKKPRKLARAVYQAVATTRLAQDFGLRDQVQRAAVSVVANIAEGFGRGGNREFIQFLSNARGSCAELKSHCYVALDAGMLTQDAFDRLYRLSGEAEGLISGFIKYLQKSAWRGRKFRSDDDREP